jgi:ABC-2 type transport system permease protein
MKRSALYQLTLARTRDFVRQPEAVFWVFGFPILLAVALGFAFREKAPDRTPIGVIESPDSASVQAALSKSPALRVRTYSRSAGEEALRVGRISLLVEADPAVSFHFDPTRPDSRVARMEAGDALQRAAGRVDPVRVGEVKVTEVGSRYIDFLIPGLLGLNLMGTGMWGVGFSIVDARTKKLLKRFVATPMRRSDYLLAQILSRLVFLAGEVLVLLGFAWLVFDVGIRGSAILLSAICFLGAMAFSGLGLLVASRAETIEAVSGWMNVVMLPMWIVSGVFFSADRFPDAVQPLVHALPLTALNDALRAVMIEGLGVVSIWGELAILAGWGVASFAIALTIFKWK